MTSDETSAKHGGDRLAALPFASMYNGIGLITARGSGTNGYVQRNLSAVRVNRTENKRPEEFSKPEVRKPNAELLQHDRKRQVEVELLKLREELLATK